MASIQDAPPVASGIGETTPLLADPEVVHERDVNGSEGGHVENGQPVDADGVAVPGPKDGNPELAKKMHILIPVIGIGVSLPEAEELQSS